MRTKVAPDQVLLCDEFSVRTRSNFIINRKGKLPFIQS